MKNKFASILFSLLLALVISLLPVSQVKPASAGATGCVPGPHHGTLTTSETWCAANNPHLVDNVFTVPSGVTLTIEPGVRVELTSGGNIGVAGSLIAAGSIEQPIIFTSNLLAPAAGSWQGIMAVDGSSLQLSYTELAYAGQPGFAFGSLAVYTTNATVSHTRIHDGSGTALFMDGLGITPQYNDVEIDHNTGAAIVQNKISMNPRFVNMQLHDNGTNGLQLPYPGNPDRDVILDGSPAALNGAPIYINYGFTVAGGTTLTIMPGTILKSNEGISVAATATLVAEGTPAEPVVFTTLVDPPVPGSWGGIIAASGSTLRLKYCELAFAGRPGFAFGAVQIETSNAMVNQCRIHGSLGHGIYIKAAAPFPMWNNVLTDNGGVALVVESSSHLEALHTTLARNQVGAYVPSGSATLSNTIVADNTIGVQQAYDGSITLTNTLFQDNTTTTYGTVSDTNHIEGAAAFGADGYHLSKGSDAIDAAIDMGIHYDIDGDLRPLGIGPDLGADEYWDAADSDATGLITAGDGGDLVYADPQGNPTEVILPPGAVSQDTQLEYKVIDPVALPMTYKQTGHAFHLWGFQGGWLMPEIAFDKPVHITLHYSDSDLAGLDRKTLTLWYWNGSGWSDAACGATERHPSQNWLSVPICHLSYFSFFAQPYRIAIPFIVHN